MADDTVQVALKFIGAQQAVDKFANEIVQAVRAKGIEGKFDVPFQYPSRRAKLVRDPSTGEIRPMGFVQSKSGGDRYFNTSGRLSLDTRAPEVQEMEARVEAAKSGRRSQRTKFELQKLREELRSHFKSNKLPLSGMPSTQSMMDEEAINFLRDQNQTFRTKRGRSSADRKLKNINRQIQSLGNRGNKLAQELGTTFNVSNITETDLKSQRDELKARVGALEEQKRIKTRASSLARRNKKLGFETTRKINEMKRLEVQYKVAADTSTTGSSSQDIFDEISQKATLQKDAINLLKTERSKLRQKRQRFIRKGKSTLAKRLYDQFEKPLMDYEIQKYADILGFKVDPSATTFDLGKGQVPSKYKTRQEQQLAARTLRQRAGVKKDTTKLREEKMRGALMSGASAAIGLFGSAGMPALNVAFAAWSGGVKAAGIAAVATAIGELIRHIETMRSSALEASKSIGAVSLAFKRSERKKQVAQAIHGIAVQGSEIQANKMYSDYWLNKTKEMNRFENVYGSIQNAIKKQGFETITPKAPSAWELAKGITNPLGAITSYGTGAVSNMIKNAFGFSQDAAKNELPNLTSSIRNFMMTNQSNRLGTDPYEEWKRGQEGFGDPTKMEQQQIFRDQLKALLEIRDNLIKDQKDTQDIIKRNKEYIPLGDGAPIW